MIKITKKSLIISPYLSTRWDNILSIRLLPGDILSFQLKDQTHAEVPHLSIEEIDEILKAHAHYINSEPTIESFRFSFPSLRNTGAIDPMAMEHNPQQANLPPLPTKLLEKIATLVKTLGIDGFTLISPPEPHCNCTYCQLARTVQQPQEIEEEVTDEDLKFRNWDVKPSGNQLYSVSNPLDETEHYTVFLGSPIGCTCGSKSCEHIRAALDS
jgi:hypothetical protein